MGRHAGIKNYSRDGYGALIRLILLSEAELAREHPALLNIPGNRKPTISRRQFEMRNNWHDIPMEDRIDLWFGSVWKGFK